MSKARIMVVEDEGIVAEDIRMNLQDFGYEVSCVVGTGAEAVRKAESDRPDLVLMDIVLGDDMDGIQAAAEIRRRLGIPIVYLTAYADEQTLERAKITDPFGYLVKPFRAEDLHSTIEMALYKHRLDAKLKESEEWFAVTLNSIGDAVIATDGEGCVKFMNPQATTLTGWEEDLGKGRPLKEVFPMVAVGGAPNSENLVEGLTSHPESSRLINCRGTLKRKDGPEIAAETSSAPIRNADGRVIGIVVVFRDVTERQAVGERLRLLCAAVEQSSEGIAIVDLEGAVIFVNKAFASMHDFTPEEVLGQNLSVFHTHEQMDLVEAAIRQIRLEGEHSGEIWHARKDGSVFPGLMHNTLLLDAEGKPSGMIGTLRDITDIKRTEEDLRSSHEELEAYSSSLEAMVAERTRALETSRAELEKYSESVEKTNEALKIIIQGIEEQKKDTEKKINHNLNLTVRPILDQLKAQETSETVQFLLKSMEYNLSNIFSSYGLHMIKNAHLLTPRELRICEMIRSGLSSKQIAKVMGISPQTVLVHRKNIRKKLDLSKSRLNLASHLKANPL